MFKYEVSWDTDVECGRQMKTYGSREVINVIEQLSKLSELGSKNYKTWTREESCPHCVNRFIFGHARIDCLRCLLLFCICSHQADATPTQPLSHQLHLLCFWDLHKIEENFHFLQPIEKNLDMEAAFKTWQIDFIQKLLFWFGGLRLP